MSPLAITIAAFIGVTALVTCVAQMLRGDQSKEVEQRLDLLTGHGTSSSKQARLRETGVLADSMDDGSTFVQAMLTRFGKLKLLFEQADTNLTPSRFFMISSGLAIFGGFATTICGFPPVATPLGAACMAGMPLLWLIYRRHKRMKMFAQQLPDALELVARALRAGHSLGSGFSLVREEMPPPIGKEFGRVFEEQNLGVTIDDSLDSLTARVPNLDLKFFSTAVVLQRQTGGDLAEILDKIGYIVRERFKIWGQVQALTGEGRLSGVVLLALPPVLFVTVYRLNPDYIMPLFTDKMGTKMLSFAIVMQLIGALVIRKIINIKV